MAAMNESRKGNGPIAWAVNKPKVTEGVSQWYWKVATQTVLAECCEPKRIEFGVGFDLMILPKRLPNP